MLRFHFGDEKVNHPVSLRKQLLAFNWKRWGRQKGRGRKRGKERSGENEKI